LHSIPSTIGVPNAITLARVLHTVAVACLSLVAWNNPMAGSWLSQALLWTGVLIAAALLVWEHRLVKATDLSRLDAAFFTMNGVISLTFFGCVLAARVVSAMPLGLGTSVSLVKP
jgi:4-hydroxybenzoate polyprenyltransferase